MTAHAPRFRDGLPAPAAPWVGNPRFNFVGGHNDAASLPVADLTRAAAEALAEEGAHLAMYFGDGGPLGHRGLRTFTAQALQRRAGMACDPDQVLVVSGSLQALDLVNAALLAPGDTVITELETYGGALSRIRARGAEPVGVPTDDQGIVPQALDETLGRLSAEGRKPKYVYLIPTVQNPTGSVMPVARRREILRLARTHDVTIFEDDCYADLVFSGERPPAIRALDDEGRVIYCGSYSKSIAPGLRIGFLVADWPVLSRLVPLKTDAGTPALEQMTLARFAPGFDAHVSALTKALEAKARVMIEALDAQFGAAADYRMPEGGIFIWVTMPEGVDTSRLAQAAAAEGVAINPGAEWCADAAHGRRRFRLCFANPEADVIREGVAKLAEVCAREFGVPERRANVAG